MLLLPLKIRYLLLHHAELRFKLVQRLVLVQVILLDVANNRIHSFYLEVVLELLLVDAIDVFYWVLPTGEAFRVTVVGAADHVDLCGVGAAAELASFLEGDDTGVVTRNLAVFLAELDEALFVLEETGSDDEWLVLQMSLLEM